MHARALRAAYASARTRKRPCGGTHTLTQLHAPRTRKRAFTRVGAATWCTLALSGECTLTSKPSARLAHAEISRVRVMKGCLPPKISVCVCWEQLLNSR
eukprot:5286583-Pleurochrysis_carterae.AAC.1